jgi:3',5'-cyclic-AMP phosphodiesterase
MFRGLKSVTIACLSVFFLVSCDKLEYSPNQKFDGYTPQNINQANLTRLANNSRDDTVRFILTGDTQRAYQDARDFVQKTNTLKGIDFVVIAGDISDFGLLQEMKWITKIYDGLNVPYIGVIGNHDLTANGGDVFRKIFGELNYSFVYHGVKFICINTNSREVNFNGTVPDINWLDTQVRPQPGVNHVVAISHVAPYTADFDSNLEQEFVAKLESTGSCLASLHAHDHNPGYNAPYENGIPFIITGGILKRNFTIITIVDGELEAKVVHY